MKHDLQLSLHVSQSSTSPEYRRFVGLLAKIDMARARLQHWQTLLPQFAQRYQTRVQPEAKRLQSLQRDWAIELEKLLLGGRWTRTEAKTLSRRLLDVCLELLRGQDKDDPEIEALFERHNGDDPNTSAEDNLEVETDPNARRPFDGDEASPAADIRSEPGPGSWDAEPWEAEAEKRHQAKAEQRASKKRAAAQKRVAEDAQQALQTVRAVYRKLAAALHPDRAPPNLSAEDRAKRTSLMQSANSAYEAGDLLALMTLQLQIEQIDATQAAQLAASRLKHFNKVLAQQLREIEQDIDERQHALGQSYGLYFQQRIDPTQLDRLLKSQLQRIEQTTSFLDFERRNLQGAPLQARRYLKAMRKQHRMEDEFSWMP